jgi:MoxR-like ATPase
MKFKCSKCEQPYESETDMLGKEAECGKCGNVFTVEQKDVVEAGSAPSAAAAVKEEEPETPYVMTQQEEWTADDMAKIGKLREANEKIMTQVRKALVGQNEVVKLTMVSLFSQGHCLLMGVPGLGKTLLVSTLASSLSLNFKRVQFTPDLMPSDITGTEVIQEDKSTGERSFRFIEGPIFTNILLADEINRTPPKTQASLLESMQERQVTVGGKRRALEPPFFVLATQNPIEQEGTYPLPEAQMDRFMFQVNVGYPREQEEKQILDMTTSGYKPDIQPVLAREEIIELQALVRKVMIGDDVINYILKLVRSSRSDMPSAPEFVRKWVSWGAGPRACQYLVIGGKAVAVLDGRNEVTVNDVKEVAHAVLGHRIQPNFAAEAEGITRQKIVDELLNMVAA